MIENNNFETMKFSQRKEIIKQMKRKVFARELEILNLEEASKLSRAEKIVEETFCNSEKWFVFRNVQQLLIWKYPP